MNLRVCAAAIVSIHVLCDVFDPGLMGFWFFKDLTVLRRLLDLHNALRQMGDTAEVTLLLDSKTTSGKFMLWLKWNTPSEKKSYRGRRGFWDYLDLAEDEDVLEKSSVAARREHHRWCKEQRRQARRHADRHRQKAMRRNTRQRQRHKYHRW